MSWRLQFLPTVFQPARRTCSLPNPAVSRVKSRPMWYGHPVLQCLAVMFSQRYFTMEPSIGYAEGLRKCGIFLK
ncbi:unnamed protein product [Fusarium graminearum]|uniref:Chromosome 4, complete genome n=1 Tax=Gibberella zeae (strain ATCC MYA-4620 / CBS 123657 / FGSC 9075 / NRRL 31084 / PH-1) TaxID=229533 RepID=A0A098DPP2_GIBZE|nr:unnamed protein product [Fusarium graminearum]CZS73238.1 unnamed protein product [Fusarium graminearum]